MRIELRTSRGCPNAEPTRRLIADCLATLGIDVPITDLSGRYASPTVLVDGVDVMRLESGPPAGDTCRLDVPTAERVIDALLTSLGRGFDAGKVSRHGQHQR